LGEQVRGGVFGYDIDDVIVAAYEWLLATYEDGDEIFIFGFSRGAFTARSLSGFISRCGLIKLGSPWRQTIVRPVSQKKSCQQHPRTA